MRLFPMGSACATGVTITFWFSGLPLQVHRSMTTLAMLRPQSDAFFWLESTQSLQTLPADGFVCSQLEAHFLYLLASVLYYLIMFFYIIIS